MRTKLLLTACIVFATVFGTANAQSYDHLGGRDPYAGRTPRDHERFDHRDYRYDRDRYDRDRYAHWRHERMERERRERRMRRERMERMREARRWRW